MTFLQKLIDQTYSYSVEARNSGNEELSSTYFSDFCSFEAVRNYLRLGNTEEVGAIVADMETAPREQVIHAMIRDNIWDSRPGSTKKSEKKAK